MLRAIPSLMVARTNYDSDAYAFLRTINTNDNTIMQAINRLVLSAKANGWWTLCVAIYPFVGGTASTHKWNLKDPRDLDAAYRLTFNGNITHSANGAVGDAGVGSNAQTYIAPNAMSQNDAHLSVYIRTNVAGGNEIDIGTGIDDNTPPGFSSSIASRYGGDVSLYNMNSWIYINDGKVNVANTDSRGWFVSNRTTSTSLKGYKNATEVGSNTIASAAPSSTPTFKLMGSAYDEFHNTSKQMAFATLGASLTTTQITDMYNDIQTFQTSLGRQI